ncbi:MAG TPA: hypothetical protein DHW45_07205 [Candidatus Latescibacteria bacterium]|jgi:hypothetical protein|nr:hypothetical protein [Candidatus Latescibacterota bacterium]
MRKLLIFLKGVGESRRWSKMILAGKAASKNHPDAFYDECDQLRRTFVQ